MSDRLHESTIKEGESDLVVTHQPDWFWDQTSLVSGGNIRHSKAGEINRKLTVATQDIPLQHYCGLQAQIIQFHTRL